MSNEVEIVIKDRDETGPGATSARRRMERLGSDTERTLGEAGKKSGKKFSEGLKAEADKGVQDTVKAVVRNLGTIDDQIEKTKKEVVELGKKFVETGNQDAFEKLRDTRGVLANLEKIKKEMTVIGEDGGRNLADGAERETTKAGPRILNGLKMSAKPAALAVGAVLGIAVAAGMGQAMAAGGAIGIAGLGAAILSQRKDVKLAGAQLVEDLKQEFIRNADPLVEPLIKSMGKIKDTIFGLGPSFKGLFADAAPAIDAMAEGLSGFIRELLPGLREFIRESGPGLKAVSEGIVQYGRDLGTALRVMSNGSKEGGEALGDLIKFAGDATIAIAGLVRGAELAGKYVPSGLNLVMKGADFLTDKFTKKLSPSTSAAADHQKTFARSLAASRRELQGLSDAALEYAEAAMGAADADIAFQQAIDDATDALKNNGKNLDISTQKGRDNKSSLLSIASAALSAAESVKEMGGSQASATRRLSDGYTAFVKAARGAGMTKAAADKLARSYGLLPPVKETKVKAPGATTAKRQVDNLRSSIRNLHGKDVFITTTFVTKGGGAGSSIGQHALATGGLVGTGISSAQTGGNRGNRVLVGEHSPEIVELPVGSRVNSGPDSQRILADTKDTLPELILQFKSSGNRLEDLLMEILRNHIDVRWGGSIDAAFRRR